jgi:tetratricopeptide (TPR) repeat protein
MKRIFCGICIALCMASCDRTGTLLEKGSVNLSLGDYRRARACFEAAVDRHPSSATARLGLGKALLQEYCACPSDSGALAGSLTQLEAARTLRPDTAVETLLAAAWFKRAEALLDALDTIAALQALSRSISLDPSSAKPVNLAGILYFRRGDRGKALNLFRKVIAIDTASVSGRFNAGMVFWADSDWTAAYDHFFGAAQRSPGDREILLWAARAKQRASGSVK